MKNIPGKIKRIIRLAAFILGLAFSVVLVLAGVLIYLNSPPVLPAGERAIKQDGSASETAAPLKTVIFEVKRGESARSVGQRLADEGLIRSRYFWALLCRINKEHIKSGNFSIEVPSSQLAIHNLLVSGKQILQRVTVPEGFTLKKTAALMEDMTICLAEDFMLAAGDPAITARYNIPGATMEGYLYPDTYLFPKGYPAERVVSAMADNFFSRIGEIDETLAVMPPEELNKTVILASIIEREYRLGEEAPVMAGVFSNRLRIGMALQSCATVEYVITEIQDRPHPEVLSSRDIEIHDPYNTYIHPGLPPGPICVPGKVALGAAFSPEKNPYLYFRLIDQGSGKHYFSGTLDDHIRAGRLYVKGRP